ncbi:MAG TPA: hypothetical protein VLA21_00960 [Candidatus Limnocylindria bacterium]|nr:hypothetical protein [Candidatus Limnocylindria bacterium]
MENRKKAWALAGLLALLALALGGCVPGDGSASVADKAGFFSGVWHGWIAPVTLVWSLFSRNVNIYEVYNNGFMYNLGYYMAIVSGFGGLALSRGKRRKRRDGDA